MVNKIFSKIIEYFFESFFVVKMDYVYLIFLNKMDMKINVF